CSAAIAALPSFPPRRSSDLPENVSFHPALTGLEQLAFYLRMRGESATLAAGLLDRVGLGRAARRRIGTYSKGMRQRLGLAQALIDRKSTRLNSSHVKISYAV